MKLNQKNTFTIDPFTDYKTYNDALTALKNNKVDFMECVQTAGSFYYFICLDDNAKPLLVNYTDMSDRQWKTSITKVLPLVINDEFKLYRRNDKVSSIFRDVVNNDAFNDSLEAKNTIIFTAMNKETVQTMSKSLKGKFYAIGRYYSKYKLWMCFDPEVKNYVAPGNILMEVGKMKVGKLEQKINFDILKNKEKIVKYSQTAYFEGGKFNQTAPMSPLWSGM